MRIREARWEHLDIENMRQTGFRPRNCKVSVGHACGARKASRAVSTVAANHVVNQCLAAASDEASGSNGASNHIEA